MRGLWRGGGALAAPTLGKYPNQLGTGSIVWDSVGSDQNNVHVKLVLRGDTSKKNISMLVAHFAEESYALHHTYLYAHTAGGSNIIES